MTQQLTRTNTKIKKHTPTNVAASPTFEQQLRSRLRATFHPGFAADTECLLLDVSGSMRDVCDNRSTKENELWKLAAQFPGVRRFAFASSCEEIPESQIRHAGGGTNMAAAFMDLKAKGIQHAVMITDGMPDNAAAALAAAKGLQVDVFYVGPDPAPQFLRDLATACGGSYGQATFGSGSKALEAGVRGLLAAPTAKTTIVP